MESSLKQPKDPITSLIEKYQQVRNTTLKLCETLGEEDHVVQPAFFVSPPKWHLGHTTWFFEKFVLKNYYRSHKDFDKDFFFLFNSY
ncbi:MAG: DinB family protein, partial [Flavobacteriales bacterium]